MRNLALGLPFLVALAALPACRSDCSPGATPRITLGTGDDAYIALDAANPTFDLVHGPQGGWHLLVAMDAAGLNATDIVVVDYEGTIDGEIVAVNEGNWQTFRCNDDTDTLQSWNTFLIFGVDSNCPLDGAEITITATTVSAKGEPVSGEVVATINDPLHDEICGED